MQVTVWTTSFNQLLEKTEITPDVVFVPLPLTNVKSHRPDFMSERNTDGETLTGADR